MIFYYVRHGDPIYDPDSLTPLGHRQAEAIGRRLAVYGVDRIYASTSKRAQLTAQPTCELLHKDMELLDFCNEGHAWADMTVQTESGQTLWVFQSPEHRRLFVTPELRAMGDDWYNHPALQQYPRFRPGIERIRKESDALFASLGYEHIPESGSYRVLRKNPERVALFAHQGFGLAFLSCLLDVPYPQFTTHFDLSHSSLTVIEFPDDEGEIIAPRVLTLANDAHIYKEGLPTNYNNYLRF